MNLYAPMMNPVCIAFYRVCNLFFTISFFLFFFFNTESFINWFDFCVIILALQFSCTFKYITLVCFSNIHCNTNTTKSLWLCFQNIIPLNAYHVFLCASKFFLQVIMETKRLHVTSIKAFWLAFYLFPYTFPTYSLILYWSILWLNIMNIYCEFKKIVNYIHLLNSFSLLRFFTLKVECVPYGLLFKDISIKRINMQEHT